MSDIAEANAQPTLSMQIESMVATTLAGGVRRHENAAVDSDGNLVAYNPSGHTTAVNVESASQAAQVARDFSLQHETQKMRTRRDDVAAQLNGKTYDPATGKASNAVTDLGERARLARELAQLNESLEFQEELYRQYEDAARQEDAAKPDRDQQHLDREAALDKRASEIVFEEEARRRAAILRRVTDPLSRTQ